MSRETQRGGVILLKAHSSQLSELGLKPRAAHGWATLPSEASEILSLRVPSLVVKVETPVTLLPVVCLSMAAW